jgi:hypothetical protein
VGALAGLAYFQPGSAGRGLLSALFAAPDQRLAWLDTLLTFLPTLAMAAVEPFYVAAGFGLYLNRRVQLEGWDLEQAFRSLGQRARERAGPLLLAALLAFAGLGLRAQEPAPSAPKAALAEVMRAPEFSGRRQVWRLRPRHPSAPAPAAPAPAWIGEAIRRLAFILKWLLPAGAVLWIILALWQHRGTLALALKPAPAPPARLFGLDIRPSGLPADLPGAAARLWDQGDHRGALALLYRGALAYLVHGLGLPLTGAATEGECLSLGGQALPGPGAEYFARLTAAWRRVAYGGRPPAGGDRDLCMDWARHFRPDAQPGARP